MDKLEYVVRRLCSDGGVGKKKLQKIVYLLERNGLDLDMPFSIHFYGPYSSNLDQCIHAFESRGILSIDKTKTTHTISSSLPKKANPLGKKENRIFNEVCEQFLNSQPLELEVLTTTDYVANYILDETKCTREAIIDKVLQIKGDKFPAEEIEECVDILQENGYIEI